MDFGAFQQSPETLRHTGEPHGVELAVIRAFYISELMRGAEEVIVDLHMVINAGGWYKGYQME